MGQMMGLLSSVSSPIVGQLVILRRWKNEGGMSLKEREGFQSSCTKAFELLLLLSLGGSFWMKIICVNVVRLLVLLPADVHNSSFDMCIRVL
mmetsp:Transcript_34670/g.50792  ORF Transcript_34670/g.50792 Transcript_34670/m.50792 type:complete len:92 (+) Transcript_34670:2388-2663(+)